VQIGDPYTQKNMHDFLLEARDQGLITFITDCGGGGLSSAVGESCGMAGGGEIELAAVPLKYQGLNPWEIWVSESQERMVAAVAPEHEAGFKRLARKHAVEATQGATRPASLTLNIRALRGFIDLSFLEEEFPGSSKWWLPPEPPEPVLGNPGITWRSVAMLDRPNICSREWITRQYDHEVQGATVIKPLVGAAAPVPGDAAVLRPRPDSPGLALSWP
jgi:phosphoribosylformylglycinamidine synthase